MPQSADERQGDIPEACDDADDGNAGNEALGSDHGIGLLTVAQPDVIEKDTDGSLCGFSENSQIGPGGQGTYLFDTTPSPAAARGRAAPLGAGTGIFAVCCALRSVDGGGSGVPEINRPRDKT